MRGESPKHAALVRKLITWTRAHFDGMAIAADHVSCIESPPSIGGFWPDLYATDGDGRVTLIGEAKTCKDLESERSWNQIKAFLCYLNGETNRCCYFVLATPYECTKTGRNIIRILSKPLSLEPAVFRYINEFGEY